MSDLQILTPRSVSPDRSHPTLRGIDLQQYKDDLDAKERQISSINLDVDELTKRLEELKIELEITRANNSINLYDNIWALFFSLVGILSLFIWITQLIHHYRSGKKIKKEKIKGVNNHV